MKQLSKSTLWRAGLFAAAALAAVSVFAVREHRRAERLARETRLSNVRAMAQLCGSVAGIDSELRRSEYAADAGSLLRIATEVSRHSEAAKCALGELPTSRLTLDRTSHFLSAAADYCCALALRSARGETLTEDDRRGLAALRASGTALSAELSSLEARAGADDFFVRADEALEDSDFSGGMAFAEESMPESPVLIYDGPYSSHISGLSARFLEKDARETGVVEGLRIAAEFLSLPDTSVRYLCRSGGDTETLTYAADDGRFLSVTRFGGFVISLSSDCTAGTPVLSGGRAAETGAAFLAERGYAGMEPTYWYIAGGICYVNYAFAGDGVLCYPDLIQLGVRLDTGDVCFLNAFGYLWNNRPGRDLSPALSAKQAAAAVSGADPAAARLCVIPTAGKNELLCYEFRVSGDRQEFLVYVNAETGAAEQIFVLVTDPSGTLTV